jgi:hypothetical protein
MVPSESVVASEVRPTPGCAAAGSASEATMVIAEPLAPWAEWLCARETRGSTVFAFVQQSRELDGELLCRIRRRLARIEHDGVVLTRVVLLARIDCGARAVASRARLVRALIGAMARSHLPATILLVCLGADASARERSLKAIALAAHDLLATSCITVHVQALEHAVA